MRAALCSDCGKPFVAAKKYDGWCPFNVNVYCPRDYECGLDLKSGDDAAPIKQPASSGSENEMSDGD